MRTGIAYQVGDALVKVAGSETRMLVLLMAVATLGAVMKSSTGWWPSHPRGAGA